MEPQRGEAARWANELIALHARIAPRFARLGLSARFEPPAPLIILRIERHLHWGE